MQQRRARTRRLRTWQAASVTRGAVRCCARLGFLAASELAGQRLRKAVRFADGVRIGGLGKLAVTERMEAIRDQSSHPVENSGGTGGGRMELAGGVERGESGAALAADVAREASSGEEACNWEQAGRKRRIGRPRVR